VGQLDLGLDLHRVSARASRVCIALLLVAADTPTPPEVLAPIATDRVLQHVPDDAPRAQLAAAGEALADWTILFAGVPIDGPWLTELAQTPQDEPLVRAARERMGRPVDLDDFVFFLDDVLVAGEAGRRGQPFDVGSGRARSAGLLVHPSEVFQDKPRVYPRRHTLAVDTPAPQTLYPPAEDGDPPGPGWTARYSNPDGAEGLITALADKRPASGFASRVAALTWQLSRQGAELYLTSTLRDQRRGYLMWGAFDLSRTGIEDVPSWVDTLNDRKLAWDLEVTINWRHPDGDAATIEAARQMAEAYDVVYATEGGARGSNHYDGVAVDLVAVDLPRTLELWAPDGAHEVFDLSDAAQPRDLSLTPELIDWIQTHFGFKKLRSDYPHWDDVGL
jgi:hypothetical protein